MANQSLKFLIVFGPIRAGKTLIARALNMHPNISVQQEPFFYFFKLCRNIFHRDILKNQFDGSQPIETDFCKERKEKELFAEFFPKLMFSENDILELIKLTRWQQESAGTIRAPKVLKYIDSLKQSNAKDVLVQLLEMLNKAYPKDDQIYVGFTEAWLDDYIIHLLNLPGLDFKCIHSLRDPRSVIASRNAGNNWKKYNGKYPILFLIRNYRKSIAYSIINKNNPNYFMLRYEDLVESPNLWFNKICNHLDIPFSEDIMHPDTYIDGVGNLWKQNTNYEKKSSGFSTNSIDKWKTVLSNEEINFIESLCHREMNFCNYQLCNNEHQLSDITSFQEDSDLIVNWLKKYNLSINDRDLALEIVRDYWLNNDNHITKDIMDYFFISEKVYMTLKQ